MARQSSERGTARDRLNIWRGTCADEVRKLLMVVTDVLSEAKSLQTICEQTIGRIAKEAVKLSQDLDTGQEVRRARALEDLVKKHGAHEAQEMFEADDYPDYFAVEEANGKDEEARSHIDDTIFPDVNDSMEQAIESMENLHEELRELLVHLRAIR